MTRPAAPGVARNVRRLAAVVSLALGALALPSTQAAATPPALLTLSQPAPQATVGQLHVVSASVTVNGAAVPDGTPVQFVPAGGLAAGNLYVGIALSAGGTGYWLAGINGVVRAEGTAPSLGGVTVAPGSEVVAIAPTPDGGGYYLVQSNGTVTTKGDAISHGDLTGVSLNQPISAIALAPNGAGYWLVDQTGGVFAFGTLFYGSTEAVALPGPIISVVASSAGYTECTSTGACFPFGTAPHLGNFPAATSANPITAVIGTPDGLGLWALEADGTVLGLGDATVPGPVGEANSAMFALAATSASGYLGLGLDGRVIPAGTATSHGDAFTAPTSGGQATIVVEAFASGTTALSASAAGGSSTPLYTEWRYPPGYWFAAADGGVFNFGTAGFHGSGVGLGLTAPVVGMAASPDGRGYWLAAADGSIVYAGDAGFYGAVEGALNKPVVAMAATPDGRGYWFSATDGGIFSFGDAAFHGSTGGLRLNKPIVGMAATPDGGGYWLVASDGGIFSFGDAAFHGSTGGLRLNKPIVGMAATPDGGGYWLVASDGGIFSFGDASFYGSTGSLHLNKPIVAMTPALDGAGYWLVASDGGVFSFGTATFAGSTGSLKLAQPIVAAAAYPSYPVQLSASVVGRALTASRTGFLIGAARSLRAAAGG